VNKDGAEIINFENDPYDGIVQQHDARYLPNGKHQPVRQSERGSGCSPRGVEFAMNHASNTAEPVFSFAGDDGEQSCCQGGFRRYPDGHSVIGWGFVFFNGGLAITEVDVAGNAVFNVNFPRGLRHTVP
jgi:hypothetical protein